MNQPAAANRDRWIFGYGSLIWRPGFRFAEARDVFVRDYQRRFWQGSPDHRGTPASPGRVVTLVDAPGHACWGRAYRIDDTEWDAVLADLDHREKAGYRRITREIFDRQAGPAIGLALLYIATGDGPDFVGPAPLSEIAEVVRIAHGPSGSNRDYLLALARALAEMQVEDDHVAALVERVFPRRARPEGTS